MSIFQSVLPGVKSESWWEDVSLSDAGLKPSFRCKDNVRFCMFQHAPDFFFLGSDTLKVDGENPEASLGYRLTVSWVWR